MHLSLFSSLLWLTLVATRVCREGEIDQTNPIALNLIITLEMSGIKLGGGLPNGITCFRASEA